MDGWLYWGSVPTSSVSLHSNYCLVSQTMYLCYSYKPASHPVYQKHSFNSEIHALSLFPSHPTLHSTPSSLQSPPMLSFTSSLHPFLYYSLLPLIEKLNLDQSEWEDIHVITGALKLFFRELPEPLVPYGFFTDIVETISE